MPSPLATVALLVVGLVLTVAGYIIFEEAIALLGLLAGLSVGVALLGNEAIPGQWDLAVLVVALVVGLVLAVTLQMVLVALFGAAIGFGVGLLVSGASLSALETLADPILGACVVLGVVGAFFLKTPIFMLASAGWGSTLLCLAFGIEPFAAQPSLQSAALAPSTPNLVFEVLGLAAQVGLWYYARTRLEDGQTIKGILTRRAGRRFEAVRS